MEINHIGHQYFGNLVLSPKRAVFETKREEDQEKDYVYVRHTPVSLNLWKDLQMNSAVFSDSSKSRCGPPPLKLSR